MVSDLLTRPLIRQLLSISLPQRRSLLELFARIPATRCRRRASCCALLPEMDLAEVLTVLEALGHFASQRQTDLIKRLVRYFLINPLAVTSCPFLEGSECRVYPVRPFGCRAYGLWSPETYRMKAETDRRAKKNLAQRWSALGVSLPREVTEFRLSYCREVLTADQRAFDDRFLSETEKELETLSRELEPWHSRFRDLYFGDLSFLTAGLIWGPREAVRRKFTLVKEALKRGNALLIDDTVRHLNVQAVESLFPR